MLVKYDVKIKPKLFPLKIYFFLKTLKLYHQDQTKGRKGPERFLQFHEIIFSNLDNATLFQAYNVAPGLLYTLHD